MSQTETKSGLIVFGNDLDNTHLVGPPPMGTLWRLLKRQGVKVPVLEYPLPEYTQPNGRFSNIRNRVDQFLHEVKWSYSDSHAFLESIKNSADLFDRPIKRVALSGRESNKHKLTLDQLKRLDYTLLLEDYHLNECTRSALWKVHKAKEYQSQGAHFIHIDDDLTAVLGIASLTPKEGEQPTLAYLLRNISNHPLLRRWGRSPDLPENVVVVGCLMDAALDFYQRLATDRI